MSGRRWRESGRRQTVGKWGQTIRQRRKVMRRGHPVVRHVGRKSRRKRRMHAWRRRRWRWQRIHRSLHQAVIIQWKVVVPMSSDQCKSCSAGTVHCGLSCFAPSPTEVNPSNSCGKDKGFLGRHTCLPSNIGCIQHAMRFCVFYKGLHRCIDLGGTVLFDKIAFPGFVVASRLFWIVLVALMMSIVL